MKMNKNRRCFIAAASRLFNKVCFQMNMNMYNETYNPEIRLVCNLGHPVLTTRTPVLYGKGQ